MTSNIKTIAILGGESTGKSTLSAALAEKLNTVFTIEYGRYLWLEKNGRFVFEDLLLIGKKQIELEDELAKRANKYLICDTTPLTTFFYSLHSFGKADPKLERLAEREYDYTFLCEPDFPFVQDGARTGNEFRMLQDRWYREELAQRNIKYYVLEGTIDDRIARILDIL